jgi:predicted Fe-S protein YdhL (DUF1289 family)
MHPETKLCQGCLRTLDEIGCWGSATPAEQHAIWQGIGERLAQTPSQ